MEDDVVVVFRLNAGSGELIESATVNVSGGPAPLALHPSGLLLYVGRRTSNQISSYRRDPGNGQLSLLGEVSLESDPCYLRTDRSGRYLFSAYYGAGRVAVHRITADGSLLPQPIAWRKTGPRAHCMLADPQNRFVFVPHIAELGGLNAIFQYRFDANTGTLNPNQPESVDAGANQGPRHLCFHPSMDLVYSSDEQGSSVSVYAFDAAAGTLAIKQTASTLPDGFVGENTCSQLQITRDARFLYAPNRGHDSVAVFKVDALNGGLTPTGHHATEKVPRAFSIDDSERYVFVAGLETARLAIYRIDQETGALQPLSSRRVGNLPMWVLVAA